VDASAAGFVATAALPTVPARRLGDADVVRLRQSVVNLYTVARRLAPYRDEPAVGEFLAAV